MARYQVARWNNFLATRERGRQVREDIESRLAELGAVVLDFADVDGITVSFGDECVARLVIARAAGDFADRGLVMEGANEDVRETLETVLARRKVAGVMLSTSGDPEVLGEVGWLPETLKAALDLRGFRASELAERLGITPQAANNRLKMLVASGAVARERVVPEGGGKEFEYRTAIPTYA
jgi:predicted ArsR family transcriptional regulator